MGYETFCRAVESMEGFGGLTALIGGEPTLHPQFERFMCFLQGRYPERERQKRLAYPQRHFIQELLRQEFESHVLRTREDGRKTFERSGIGIYSNMSAAYHKYHEQIQDTFQVQFLNDHINPSFHQPGLISRKDLGIPDADWYPMRDGCWLQNAWSATITPKGAFFCEVAAAMDMLFDGPGGWPIEPGWWKRKPGEFGEQLEWCELCGFPLHTFMRESSDGIDDVSPTLYEKLKEMDSPGLKTGRTRLVEIRNGEVLNDSDAMGKSFHATQKYVEHYEDRFNAGSSLLYDDGFDRVYFADGDDFGRKLNKCISKSEGWILFSEDENAGTEVSSFMRESVMNPGTMHLGDNYALFNRNALSLVRYGYDRVAGLKSFDGLVSIWSPEKVVHMNETDDALDWKRDSIRDGKRYAVWGMGFSGSFIADAVKCSGGMLVIAVDNDEAKQKTDFYGADVHGPVYLRDHPDEYDYLIIGHYSRFDEILDEALGMGIPREKIIMPYEV
jgi:hypothetical protein